MDIYERITDDHDMQRALCDQLAKTSGDTEERRRLFDELKAELEAHAAVEEQTFYAELIEKPEGQEQARHSVAEHKDASDLLEELSELEMSSGGWLNKFKKLKEDVDHHLDEEEEEVFELARQLIAHARAEELAETFDKRKREYQKGGLC